jgi:hypothetical protein
LPADPRQHCLPAAADGGCRQLRRSRSWKLPPSSRRTTISRPDQVEFDRLDPPGQQGSSADVDGRSRGHGNQVAGGVAQPDVAQPEARHAGLLIALQDNVSDSA